MPRSPLHAALVLAGLLPLAAQAATDAGQILNEQQRAAPLPSRPADPPVLRVPEAPAPAAAATGLRMTLKAVRFSGATGLADPADLQARVAPQIGRTLDHGALQQIADELTRWLRGRGFVLARAYLPRQDVTEGTLEIALVDGRLQSGQGRVVIGGETRIARERLAAIADAALPDGAALRTADLERALLLMNDLPGLSARSTLERGDAPGTSKLVVDAREGEPLAGIATLDNYGGRSTGTARLSGRFEWLDPLAIGDAFGLNAGLSEGTKVLGLSYSLPLSADGWRLRTEATTLRYSVGGALEPLDLEGRADSLQIAAAYPWIRTRALSLGLDVGYQLKRLRDDGAGTNLRRRRLDGLRLGLAGSRFDDLGGGGLVEAGAAVIRGRADLSGNPADEQVDAASARTDGGYTSFSAYASRLQSLDRVAPAWSLFTSLRGQLASRNLDSSEKFLLGGPSGVRAYPIGEAPGDEGAIATIELRRALTLPQVASAQAFGFIDAGMVRLHDRAWPGSVDTTSRRNRYSLTGIGLGASVAAGPWSLRATLAHALGSNPGRSTGGTDADGRSSRNRAWLQASIAF